MIHYSSSIEKHSGSLWTEDVGLNRGQVIESLISHAYLHLWILLPTLMNTL